MAYRYKLFFEIVTSERMTELSAESAQARFAEEFAKGTQYTTEEGRAGEILDSKIEVVEEIL